MQWPRWPEVRYKRRLFLLSHTSKQVFPECPHSAYCYFQGVHITPRQEHISPKPS